MIDIHAHLNFEQYDEDRGEVIHRAFESGVKKIINVGTDEESSESSVKLAEKYKEIHAAVGIHPHEFNNLENHGKKLEDQLNKLKNLAKSKKVAAVGEIGLDYFSHTANFITEEQRENQRKGFAVQLELAKELNMPVIIHCREAYGDAYDILSSFVAKNHGLNFVLHCYGGSAGMTDKFLKLGSFFSFAGNITFAKPASELLEVIKMLPLDKIMIETDCPFLAPVPRRGKRNEPAYLKHITEKLAEIKDIKVKEVIDITDQNARKFFSL